MAGQKEGKSKREVRRRKRKKIMIIAYTLLAAFLAALGIGIFFGVKWIMGVQNSKPPQQEEMQAGDAESAPEAVSEPETTRIKAAPMEQEKNALDIKVEEKIGEMSLEDKVAGLFMVTPEGLTGAAKVIQAGNGTKEALLEYPVGGLIYFAENIQSEEQLKTMLFNTVSFSRYPLFLGIDEEGGKVARLGNSELNIPKVEEAKAIGESGDSRKAYEAAAAIASYLSEYGFNVDFAPVADVLVNPGNEVIGSRAYSGNAEVVSAMSEQAVKGLQENGISACMKHFPGIGGIEQDPHEEAAALDRSLSDMRETDFIPYITGIEAGTDMIMVSNVTAAQVTGDSTPCCMSAMMVQDILRTELGYQGIIITDAMNMAAISEKYTPEEAAVEALQAGVDMILMPEDFKAAYEGVLKAVQEQRISEERINESLRRIYRVKGREG